MSDRIDELFAEALALLGEDTLMNTFSDKIKGPTDIDERIKILEAYALDIIEVPSFNPKKDYIRFRKIRLLRLKRIHSLLVDVIKNKRRYTAALKKRISTGERDPKKWRRDVNEAVEIALSSKPVALCAVENRINDHLRGVVEVFYDDDDHNLEKGVVFVWDTQVADARGPIGNVIDILKRLHYDQTEGLIIQPASKEVSNRYVTVDKQSDEDGRGGEIILDDQQLLQEDLENDGTGQDSSISSFQKC